MKNYGFAPYGFILFAIVLLYWWYNQPIDTYIQDVSVLGETMTGVTVNVYRDGKVLAWVGEKYWVNYDGTYYDYLIWNEQLNEWDFYRE